MTKTIIIAVLASVAAIAILNRTPVGPMVLGK
jgi:hypothetical protein